MEDYDDDLDWSDEEDIICSSRYISSDEDEDIPIIPKNKISSKKGGCARAEKKEDGGQDDFEREMASELSQTVQQLAAAFTKAAPHSSSANQGGAEGKKAGVDEDGEFYDDVYFDSDDDDTEETNRSASGGHRARSRHRVMTNDELLYDPTLDDQDQEWVNRQRRSYQVKQRRGMARGGRGRGGKSSGTADPLPRSDAVLNCPACLTTLCMDCQRHQIYHNQYRAMFVFNCGVDKTESLKFPSKNQKKKEYFRNKKKKKGQQTQEEPRPSTEDKDMGRSGQDTDGLPELNAENVASPSSTAMESSPTGLVSSTTKPDSLDTGPASSNTGPDSLDTGPASSNTGPDSSNTGPTSSNTGPTSSNTVPDSLTTGPNSSTTCPQSSSLQSAAAGPEASLVGGNGEELYHPVMCKICNTKVAVYDKDEIYHFFNVITSY